MHPVNVATVPANVAPVTDLEAMLRQLEAEEEVLVPTEALAVFDRAAFDTALRMASECGASDIHFSGQGRIALRVNGELEFLPYAAIASGIAEELIFGMITDASDRETLRQTRELDFSFTHTNHVHYRCNAYYKNDNLSIAMRRINTLIPTLDQLGAPEKLHELIRERQGMILVCGPTGHGKTTTMAAMIEEINATRHDHILTLEDPIEHVFESKQCMVSQRELNTDTLSFEKSLRAAMRQDPDIIVVGEVRDRETAQAVFNLVATGHLVITTVHATNAAQTLYRIARMFPPEERDMVLNQMADALLGIVNQRLVRSTDGGRVAIFEMLVANYAVQNSVRNGDVAQLVNTIAMSADEGMLTFEHSAGKLILDGKVDHAAVAPYLDHRPAVEFFV
ncbi:MAG: PilT/PilU family type 4a pilus ATPase [Candidatus Moranbacteria bacterium]|nr:PilT/PilU family type 4a pilus ATPase [Candidatus Moranbacteria bacterium]